MVSRKNISGRQDLTPPAEGAKGSALKIDGGPLYDPTDVLRVLDSGTKAISLWTADCNYEVSIKLEWDMSNVHALIGLALKRGVFKGSEWCHQSGDGPIAACDAYRVSQQEWVKTAKKEMTVSYFVKFAISKTGMLLLVVSCHV